MVWKFIFSGKSKYSFDSHLLKCIKVKNNKHAEFTLQTTKNLYSAVDSSGASLLHYAAEFGNEIVTQRLIESGAKIDLQNEKGKTPLMLATKGCHEGTIRLLLEYGADIYLSDNDGVSALQLAVRENFMPLSIIEMFLTQVKTNCPDSNAMAKKLLSADCPLYIVVTLKNIKVVEYMLANGTHIDDTDPKSNQTALHLAVKDQDLEMVKLLVDHGADVNFLDVQKQTPLSLIRSFEQTEILEILVKNGTKLTACTEDRVMQLYWVLTSGTFKAVEIVFESGFDLLAKDSHGQTILHYLANNVNKGIVEVIDQWIGCEIDEDNDNVFESFLDDIISIFISEELNERKVDENKVAIDWNAKDEEGKTALHIAMAAGNPRFVEYLLDQGAEVNVKTIKGVTPFFAAIESSQSLLEQRIKCVKLVMDRGAYPDVDMERYLQIYNTKSVINRDFLILEPVLANLVLRQAKGERISKNILEYIDCHPRLKDYVVSCKDELDRMKNADVNAYFTLFDFLTETEKPIGFYVEVYLKLEELIEKHKCDSYYYSIVRRRFSRLTYQLVGGSKDMFVIWCIIWAVFLMIVLYDIISQCGFRQFLPRTMIVLRLLVFWPMALIFFSGFEVTYMKARVAYKAFLLSNKKSVNLKP